MRRRFPASSQQRFIRLWTEALRTDGKRFAGLYSGLYNTAAKKQRQPEKLLREWLARARYAWEDAPVVHSSKALLRPAIESGDAALCALCAGWLLKACGNAGIRRERGERVLLTEDTADAYISWNDAELYPGDRVRVINPAWYQDGRLLDQGHCTSLETDSRE